MNRLNWEINNRAECDDDVARRSPHAARQPLTDADLESKRRERQQLASTSSAWRAFTHFMGCYACQTCWTPVAVYAITRNAGNLAGWFFTAAASSGAGVLLSIMGSSGQNRLPGRSSQAACKSCGE
jgi:hypothetical protein